MKAGIMQPYLFPYLGYFSIIKHTDIYILSDEVQYSHHAWVGRNRILKPNEGWQYINVPLIKNKRLVQIKEVLINNSFDWKSKILAQLYHYKKIAPYYDDTIQLINNIFSKEYNTIAEFNIESIKIICGYLDFSAKIGVFSEMNLQIDKPSASDEWSLNICKALNYSLNKSIIKDTINEYWNAPGGIVFYDESKYSNNGIKLRFLKNCLTPYDQGRKVFEPGLSIIDVLMFNSIEETNLMLGQYEMLKKECCIK